ncbi:MAG: recombinase family protein [Anaerolineaceae bacterium]|nr:recombinase family protein [Oscillospiraceae bacterium]MBQ6480422.1 recombinase family protein [Anaerolineaceae bacterium]
MPSNESREELRQLYRREDTGEKTFIPAKPKVDLYGAGYPFRACAYCRVSTDNDEQLSSFELQQAHYKQLVLEHPNWELKQIYADEGISGTSLKNRDAFNEMIEACKRGEYDLIITKSVSRFARNLVDCISLIRMLKGQNPPVGVYFESDNLYTLSENTEFMLSFLATFAQEESVKKSEAMNWSLQQRFKDGKLLTPAPLGYDRPKDVTGRYIKYAPLEVNEAEAKVVRFIYDAYLSGWSQEQIASFLTDIGCETKSGGTGWNTASIGYILTNERYCGNVLTWKTFTADLYEHKHKKNKQDRDQYLYKDRHEAIVTVEKFEAVQVLMENRKHHIRGGLPMMHVIDEGIFRGFIPINHHWVNDDPGTYYDISNSVRQVTGTVRVEKRKLSAFDLEGYQVVRGQFMQIRFEGPCLTISNDRISFNKFCVQKFENVAYIQLLLHPAERKIAIRPCQRSDAHSIKWRPDPDKPVYVKTLNCQHFGNALYSIMGWNPDYVYKTRGTWACRGSEQIIVYNLPNAVPAVLVPPSEGEDTSGRRRVNLCPEEWDDDFGAEFYEHTLENGFYYIAPKSEWHSQAKSILAPGIEQYTAPTPESLQLSMDSLMRGMEADNGQSGT